MSVEQTHRHTLPTHEVVTRYATIDIETSGIDPSDSQTVAIGLGTYDALSNQCSVDVLTYGGAQASEAALIRRAFERIDEFDPDALVTYNGEWFDLDYLEGRIERLEFARRPELECADHHVDLFLPRKERAEQLGQKWPSLEEVLEAYGYSAPVTQWSGGELTNRRFGAELAPAYLEAINSGDAERTQELESTIYEYTAGDVEANIVLYELDAGRR